jgi:peptidoglycan/xylan/chitin deacetylase (PgdA/CDA1 family)
VPSYLNRARTLLLAAAKGASILALVRDSRWRSERLLILGYHGISLEDEHEWNGGLYMPQPLFRRRMELLDRGGYQVLPLAEALERLYKRDLPPRAVALTFDDGTYDFHARACPVLAEFGFPATVYVTSYFVARRYPVFQVFIQYLLWKGRDLTPDLSGVAPGLARQSLKTFPERLAMSIHIRKYREREDLGNEETEALCRRLAQVVGQDYDALCRRRILHLMTPDEVAELSRFGVTAQLHTHRHRTPDDEALFRREVRDNREHLAKIGIPPASLTHFCYPSGIHRREYFEWLAAEGVRSAVTCVPSLATSGSPRLALPRVMDTCGLTDIEFEGWLAGASQFFPRRKENRARPLPTVAAQ